MKPKLTLFLLAACTAGTMSAQQIASTMDLKRLRNVAESPSFSVAAGPNGMCEADVNSPIQRQCR